jgi:hypothetical protein
LRCGVAYADRRWLEIRGLATVTASGAGLHSKFQTISLSL